MNGGAELGPGRHAAARTVQPVRAAGAATHGVRVRLRQGAALERGDAAEGPGTPATRAPAARPPRRALWRSVYC